MRQFFALLSRHSSAWFHNGSVVYADTVLCSDDTREFAFDWPSIAAYRKIDQPVECIGLCREADEQAGSVAFAVRASADGACRGSARRDSSWSVVHHSSLSSTAVRELTLLR